MTAGATALLALFGGGVAGMMTGAGEDSRTVAAAGDPVAETGLGAPRLEESPEVVSRAAAAAEPLPQRHTPAPPRTARTAPVADQLSRARGQDERADRTRPRPGRTTGRKSAGRPAPHAAPASVAVAEPLVTTRTDVETRAIPFDTQVIRDRSLPPGVRRIESPGQDGEETLRYRVTLTDGRPTARVLVGTEVTREPEPRIVVVGARHWSDRACEGALRLCVPLGRSATCPEDGSGDTGPDTGKAGPGTDKAGPGTDKAGSGTDKAGSGTDKAGPGTDKAGPGTDEAASGTDKARPATDKAGPGTERAGSGKAGSGKAGSGKAGAGTVGTGGTGPAPAGDETAARTAEELRLRGAQTRDGVRPEPATLCR